MVVCGSGLLGGGVVRRGVGRYVEVLWGRRCEGWIELFGGGR